MIRFIRSVLCALCFCVFGIGGILMGCVIFPVVLIFFSRVRQQKIFVNTVHLSWRAFVWMMSFLRLIQINCPKCRQLKSLHGTIVIANHPSLIDVVILVSKIPNAVCVVKTSLFHNIFVRHVIRRAYMSNTMTPDEFIAHGGDILSRGYNIIIFPEGTRTIPNRAIHLHRGFAYLHMATGANILPIKITNTPPILGKTQKWWDVGATTSRYDIRVMPYICHGTTSQTPPRTAAIEITQKAKRILF